MPNGQQLDTLADALASLEYYLEALRDQRPEPRRHPRHRAPEPGAPALLAAAVKTWAAVRDHRSARRDRRRHRAGRVAGVAGEPEHRRVERVAVEIAQRRCAGAGTGAHEAPPRRRAGAGGFEHSDDIDDEIREVFLEELEEEIANLGELLPQWRQAPDDGERLRPIRRVFHTLKGSGRLVGAKTLGEFSWKIENMLNRVLDGTRPASPAVIALVAQVHETLPQLHAALQGSGRITADLAGIEAIADRLGRGRGSRCTSPALSAPSQPVVECRRSSSRGRR